MSVAERQRPPAGALFLDHVAHFVPDLARAAEALEALGFVATPRSDHRTQDGPAGTSNRCIMLEEGYIELLAGERGTGVQLACFGTPDAQGEHWRLRDHGFDPQSPVRLEREVEGGKAARFIVVRPAPAKMPEGRVQYVQQLTPGIIWLDRYLSHENGVTGLAGVFVVAGDPVEVAARWARFAGLLPRPQGNGVRLDTARGWILVSTSKHLIEIFGAGPAAPALAGYALACRDPAELVARCSAAGIPVRKCGRLYAALLPPAVGGSWLFGTREALSGFAA